MLPERMENEEMNSFLNDIFFTIAVLYLVIKLATVFVAHFHNRNERNNLLLCYSSKERHLLSKHSTRTFVNTKCCATKQPKAKTFKKSIP